MSPLRVYTPPEKYDWCMTNIPQPNAGNKAYSMPGGKLLGDRVVSTPHVRKRVAEGPDGWASLGNKGWGWDNLAPYIRKHQTLDRTELKSKDSQFMPHAGADKWYGTDGPIHTSSNDWYMLLEEDFAIAAYQVTRTE